MEGKFYRFITFLGIFDGKIKTFVWVCFLEHYYGFKPEFEPGALEDHNNCANLNNYPSMPHTNNVYNNNNLGKKNGRIFLFI